MHGKYGKFGSNRTGTQVAGDPARRGSTHTLAIDGKTGEPLPTAGEPGDDLARLTVAELRAQAAAACELAVLSPVMGSDVCLVCDQPSAAHQPGSADDDATTHA